nr:MAG TPA: Deleted in esophageal cancer 1 family [Caudoviricetes sp.]
MGVFCKVGVVGGLARGWWLALGAGVCYNGGYEYVR